MRCRSAGTTGSAVALAAGPRWPSFPISAATLPMLCWSATSGFGMPGTATSVGTGYTRAQPARTSAAMRAGAKRIVSAHHVRAQPARQARTEDVTGWPAPGDDADRRQLRLAQRPPAPGRIVDADMAGCVMSRSPEGNRQTCAELQRDVCHRQHLLMRTRLTQSSANGAWRNRISAREITHRILGNADGVLARAGGRQAIAAGRIAADQSVQPQLVQRRGDRGLLEPGLERQTLDAAAPRQQRSKTLA